MTFVPFTVWNRFEAWPFASLALCSCPLSGFVRQPHRSVPCHKSHLQADARSEWKPMFPHRRAAAAIVLSGGGTVGNV